MSPAVDEPVDWALAERIGARIAVRQPAPRVDLTELQRSLEPLVGRAESLVADCTGLRSTLGPARIEVVDRAAWVRANVAGFRRLLSPAIERWAARTAQQRGGGTRTALAVTRRIAGFELGALLGWMGTRVLGQYDLLVATGDESSAGDTVYLVGPNLVNLEQRFGFPPDQFRLWVTLHEITHRAQFTGVPWMRGHYLDLVQQVTSFADIDPGQLLTTLRAAVQERGEARARLAEGGLAAVLATPEQRRVLGSIAGMMAVLEGHGDLTMTRAGGDLIPSAERFVRVLSARRRQANPLARVVQRAVGLEAKLDQYALGARFITTIEAELGPSAVDRCWSGPEALPTLDEVRQPERWLARTGSADAHD